MPESRPTIVDLFSEALSELANAGRVEEANRLAAVAYVGMRHDDPVEAEIINALMHRLCRTSGRQTNKEGPMPTDDQTLDVRDEPPARRHELIFQTYEALADGQGFVLVNDHDPKPLEYQFAAERAGQFTWDYLEQGPAVWRVRIGKPADEAA